MGKVYYGAPCGTTYGNPYIKGKLYKFWNLALKELDCMF